jgi:hypothetical protein
MTVVLYSEVLDFAQWHSVTKNCMYTDIEQK